MTAAAAGNIEHLGALVHPCGEAHHPGRGLIDWRMMDSLGHGQADNFMLFTNPKAIMWKI
jgi:hypothetical protein